MPRLNAADGLTLDIDDAGALRIGWGAPDWFGPGMLSLHASAPRFAGATASSGADDLGDFSALELTWSELPFALRTSVRAYADTPLLVLRLQAPDGLSWEGSGRFADPGVAWPHFRPRLRRADGAPPEARTYGHQWAEFALPVFGDADGAGMLFAPHRPPVVQPLLLIAPDGRTLLIGPLDSFHEQLITVPTDAASLDDGLRCGWHGDLVAAPPGFATELAIWAAPGPRAALEAWIGCLRRRAGTRRPSRYADAGLARLSYWTDNGAAYYYRTAPGEDYLGTLVAAVDDCEARGLPIGLVQIDSWFYPHQHLRPVSEEGAPIVPPSGMLRWEPRQDLFPDGFATLSRRLGNRPLAFHSRHFAAASPYFERHAAWTDGEYAHPRQAGLVEHLMASAASWGAQTYEQDWLVESFTGVRGLREAPGRARAWQEQLDAAAAAQGMTLQWCMAAPADFLQTVTLERVTSIRTSGDYRYLFDNGLNWVWLLHVNALARALGLNAFKDVFLSDRAAEPYAEIEALLAVLCAGPVGIGDAIGRADAELVRRTCREDGVLVKPDVPLAALERCFLQHRHLVPRLLFGETHSTHGELRWLYVVTLHASSTRTPLRERLALADLGPLQPRRPVVMYDWRRGTCETLAPDGGWEVELPFQDWDYRVLCPLLPGERALFGDVARYATMGDRRVANVAFSATQLSFDVSGMPHTEAVFHGWSAATPRTVGVATYADARELRREDWSWEAATGRWVARLGLSRMGCVRVTVEW
ncbi:MAG: hypothetical protein ABI629_16290 [bacterium]